MGAVMLCVCIGRSAAAPEKLWSFCWAHGAGDSCSWKQELEGTRRHIDQEADMDGAGRWAPRQSGVWAVSEAWKEQGLSGTLVPTWASHSSHSMPTMLSYMLHGSMFFLLPHRGRENLLLTSAADKLAAPWRVGTVNHRYCDLCI